MRNKTKKSPVIYWTSKWVPTDEYITRSTSDNKLFKAKKQVLVGKRNKELAAH